MASDLKNVTPKAQMIRWLNSLKTSPSGNIFQIKFLMENDDGLVLSLVFAGHTRQIVITTNYPKEHYYDIGTFQVQEISQNIVHHEIFNTVSKNIVNSKFRLSTLMENLVKLLIRKNTPAPAPTPAKVITTATSSSPKDKVIIVVNDTEQSDWDDEIDFETKSDKSSSSTKSQTFYVKKGSRTPTNTEQESLIKEILDHDVVLSSTDSLTTVQKNEKDLVATIVDEADDVANLPGEVPIPVIVEDKIEEIVPETKTEEVVPETKTEEVIPETKIEEVVPETKTEEVVEVVPEVNSHNVSSEIMDELVTEISEAPEPEISENPTQNKIEGLNSDVRPLEEMGETISNFESGVGIQSRSFRSQENLLDPGGNNEDIESDTSSSYRSNPGGGSDLTDSSSEFSDCSKRTTENNVLRPEIDSVCNSDFSSDFDLSEQINISKIVTKRNPNEILFNCAEDDVGIYYDMKHLVKNLDDIDIDILIAATLADKQKTKEAIGISDQKRTFSEASLVRVIANEIKVLQTDFYELEFVKGNLYNWNVRFKPEYFNSKIEMESIVVNFHLDARLYPFFPPKVRIVEPVVDYQTRTAFATLPCLKSWGPTSSLKQILQEIADLEIKVTDIHPNAKLYDLHGLLLDLALYETPTERKSQTKTSSQKSIWAKGLGYGGTKGASKWDVASSLRINQQRAQIINSLMEKILLQISKILIGNSNEMNAKLIALLENSPFVTNIRTYFSDTLLRVMLENLEKFDLFVNCMRIFPNKYLNVFGAIYQLLKPTYEDCQIYLDLNKKSALNSVNAKTIASIERFVRFYHRLEKCSKITTDVLCGPQRDLGGNIEQIYVETLKPLQFVTVPDKPPKTKGKKTTSATPTPQCIKRIIAELAEMQGTSNRLNLYWSSSVFFKNYEDDITQMEFIICGTEGTPYDSGCFLFSMNCPSNYPTTNPLVKILTTGGNTVNFNPNLFSHGLVCLSLLGTLAADKSESWIPGTSNMMQIILSIQSLVMNSEPYLNSYAHIPDMTSEIQQGSLDYSASLIANTMKFAITEQIKCPPKGFESTIEAHFKLKASYIKSIYDPETLETKYNYVKVHKEHFQKTYKEMCEALDLLC
jgi:ubiquitin-protein ligase